jgi:hypothetical protein
MRQETQKEEIPEVSQGESPHRLSNAESYEDNTQTQKPVASTVDVTNYLETFANEIDPTTISRIESRVDGAIVIHCTDLYECLKYGYQRDSETLAKIDQHWAIFQALSKRDTLDEGMKQLGALPETEREWVTSMLSTSGSAYPVEFHNGEKKGIVIMNDIETKRFFNADLTPRNPDQLAAYGRDYLRTLEHEVRHVLFYDRYGRDLESAHDKLEAIRPLTVLEQQKYHINRLTKDEVCAHIENEVIESTNEAGQITTTVNWQGIVTNLMKPDYCDPRIFPSETDRTTYHRIVETLVEKARVKYEETHSIEKVMEELMALNIEKMLSN